MIGNRRRALGAPCGVAAAALPSSRIAFAVILCLLILTPAVRAEPLDRGDVRATAARAVREPVDGLIDHIEHAHPVAMFLLAKRLFDIDRRDEAVFWFYVGQLRWRAYLTEHPRDRDQNERFVRLFETIGPDINQYAFCDEAAFFAMVDRVLAWDAAHPDEFTSNAQAKDRIRQGMRDLVAHVRARSSDVRARQAEICAVSTRMGEDRYAVSGGALFGTPQEMLTEYDPARFASFRVGVTTRTQVLQALGRPELWSAREDGKSEFVYGFARSFLQGAPTTAFSERVSVGLSFDAANVLAAIELPERD